MQCFTGDDTGLLKRVGLSPPSVGALQRWGTQAHGGGVACACWGPAPEPESCVGVGLDTGAVRFWSASPGASEEPVAECSSGTGAVPLRVCRAWASLVAIFILISPKKAGGHVQRILEVQQLCKA